MAKEEKKSIIENALADYKQIQEAAENNAAKKLAKEFPEKFNDLLKEEINNKNNNNSEKEPYKKVENKESNNLDESEDKNTESKMKKEKKKETKKVTNEEREKSFMADVEKDTPNMEKEKNGDGVAFKEKTSGDTVANKTNAKKAVKKDNENINEEFDITDLDTDNTENAIDNADSNDEIVTMEEIENEISEMEQLKDNLEDNDNPIASMKDKLQEMLNSIEQMEEQKQQGGKQNYKGRENGGPTGKMIDESNMEMLKKQLIDFYNQVKSGAEVPKNTIISPELVHNSESLNDFLAKLGVSPSEEDEMSEQKQQGGKQNYKGRENGGPTTKMIDEEEPITDDDIENVLNDDSEVDEAMGIAHSSSKHVAGDHLPGEDSAKHRHKRYGSFNNPTNESVNKKYSSLLKENKQLSKKINESKKYKETVDKLLENYKTALEKYRTQLKEMAVFNTNLAHVNNILVNESLALTQEDKINVINDFKKVNTIGESKKKYDKILSEMKKEKKTISENIEDKVSKTVGKSSKEKLVEEKTAYENDEHIGKMKKMIEQLEKNDKKKIIK